MSRPKWRRDPNRLCRTEKAPEMFTGLVQHCWYVVRDGDMAGRSDGIQSGLGEATPALRSCKSRPSAWR